MARPLLCLVRTRPPQKLHGRQCLWGLPLADAHSHAIGRASNTTQVRIKCKQTVANQDMISMSDSVAIDRWIHGALLKCMHPCTMASCGYRHSHYGWTIHMLSSSGHCNQQSWFQNGNSTTLIRKHMHNLSQHICRYTTQGMVQPLVVWYTVLLQIQCAVPGHGPDHL